jgi:predicted ribosome quality control (RQC) complex YloA/Tae2 family protein
LQAIQAGRERLTRRRARLLEEEESAGDAEAFRQRGEAILAHIHHIQSGQSELVVEWVAGETLRVPLDPTLSASDNAQVFFKRYRKAQRAADEIPIRLNQVGAEESYLDQLVQDLDMAENRPEIDAVAEALTKAGYLKEKRKRGPQATRPMRFTSPDGFTVWVGKNAQQNEKLTFDIASSDDLWLHARGMPGAHVIVRVEGQPVPQRTVEWAAGLAAYYSRGRDDTRVEVDVVERQHVRRRKGGRPGQVVYRNEQTLRVVPLPPDEV